MRVIQLAPAPTPQRLLGNQIHHVAPQVQAAGALGGAFVHAVKHRSVNARQARQRQRRHPIGQQRHRKNPTPRRLRHRHRAPPPRPPRPQQQEQHQLQQTRARKRRGNSRAQQCRHRHRAQRPPAALPRPRLLRPPPQRGQAHAAQGGKLVALAQIAIRLPQPRLVDPGRPVAADVEILQQPQHRAHTRRHQPRQRHRAQALRVGLHQRRPPQQRHAGTSPTQQIRQHRRIGPAGKRVQPRKNQQRQRKHWGQQSGFGQGDWVGWGVHWRRLSGGDLAHRRPLIGLRLGQRQIG